jgi:hypothetical protein
MGSHLKLDVTSILDRQESCFGLDEIRDGKNTKLSSLRIVTTKITKSSSARRNKDITHDISPLSSRNCREKDSTSSFCLSSHNCIRRRKTKISSFEKGDRTSNRKMNTDETKSGKRRTSSRKTSTNIRDTPSVTPNDPLCPRKNDDSVQLTSKIENNTDSQLPTTSEQQSSMKRKDKVRKVSQASSSRCSSMKVVESNQPSSSLGRHSLKDPVNERVEKDSHDGNEVLILPDRTIGSSSFEELEQELNGVLQGVLPSSLSDERASTTTTKITTTTRKPTKATAHSDSSSNVDDTPIIDTSNVDDTHKHGSKSTKKKKKKAKKNSTKEKSKNRLRGDGIDDIGGTCDTGKCDKEYCGSRGVVGKKRKESQKVQSEHTAQDNSHDDLVEPIDSFERAIGVGGTTRKATKKRKGCDKGKKKSKATDDSFNGPIDEPQKSKSIETDQSPTERHRSEKVMKETPKSILSASKSKRSAKERKKNPRIGTSTGDLQHLRRSPGAESVALDQMHKKKAVSFHLKGDTSSQRGDISNVSPTKTSGDSRLDEAERIRIVKPGTSRNKKARSFRSPSLFLRRKASNDRTCRNNDSIQSSMNTIDSSKSLQTTHRHHKKSYFSRNAFFGRPSSPVTVNTTSACWYNRSDGSTTTTDTSAGVSYNHNCMMEMVFFDSTKRDEST